MFPPVIPTLACQFYLTFASNTARMRRSPSHVEWESRSMKMSTLVWTGVLTCTLLVSGAAAQQLQQPLSVRPVGFNYNNYQNGEVTTSPSDIVGSAVAESRPVAAPSATTTKQIAVNTNTNNFYTATTTPSCDAGAPCAAAPAACDSGCATPSCGGCDSCSGGCGSFGGGCLSGCLSSICSDCCLGDAWTLSGALHGNCPPPIKIGGWFSAGYHSEGNGKFNNRPDELALHQGWIYAEKAATCDSRFGFRADFMYGIDADDTQAFGNPAGTWDFQNGFDHGAYGWAIPQLYGEIAINDTWSVKAGHFYTLVGYEVVTAPNNFFYSHAMTMYLSEPFMHTGVVATGSISDDFTVYAGWTLGWDTGFDQLNSGNSWLGGFSYSMSDNASLTYISTAGNFGWRGDEAYSHSVVLDMNVSDKLNWVVQSDLLDVGGTGENTIGLNQYLLYTVNDCLGLGARIEWYKGDVLTGYAPHGGVVPATGNYSNYAATFGANIRPHANIVLRPEVRIDWSPAADYDESYYGVDAIFTF